MGSLRYTQNGVLVDYNGTSLGVFGILNFAGAGVTVVNSGGGEATITIPGSGTGGVDVSYNSTLLGMFTNLNFLGAGVTVVNAGGGTAAITIAGPANPSPWKYSTGVPVSAVLVGSASTAAAPYSVAGGNLNVISSTATNSDAWGTQNQITGQDSSAGGNGNTNNGYASSLHGSSNQILSGGEYNFVHGLQNISGTGSIANAVFGGANNIGGVANLVMGSTVVADGNSQLNCVCGYAHQISSHGSLVAGSSNQLLATTNFCIVGGQSNNLQVNTVDSLVVGNSNANVTSLRVGCFGYGNSLNNVGDSVVMGSGNTVTELENSLISGESHDLQNVSNAIINGQNNQAYNAGSTNILVSGVVCQLGTATIAAANAIVTGESGFAIRQLENVRGYSQFATPGDNQRIEAGLMAVTTVEDTPVSMTIANTMTTATKLIMPVDSSWSFFLQVQGVVTVAGVGATVGDVLNYYSTGAVKNVSGIVSFVTGYAGGGPSYWDASFAGTEFTLVPNNTDSTLDLQVVTPQVGTTVQWTALIYIQQSGWGAFSPIVS
jgi:hypothetical protein